MRRHYLHLTKLFAALLPACGGGGGGDDGDNGSSDDPDSDATAMIDQSMFTSNICGVELVQAVTPGVAVDSLEHRTVEIYSSGGEGPDHGPVTVVGMRGEHCSAATDEPACLAAVDAIPLRSEIRTGSNAGDGYWAWESFVYTRGDEVGSILRLDSLKTFLADLESDADAALWARMSSKWIRCNVPNNIGPDPEGHVLFVRSDGACLEDLVDSVLLVTTDGSISVRESQLIQEDDPSSCDSGRLPPGLCRQPRSPSATPIGAYLAQMAELETASIPAFLQLARELAGHGAPRPLVRAAVKAAGDEVRHARTMTRHARRFGGQPKPPVVAVTPLRSLVDIALDNAVEGCVRETFGAASAHLCARTAADRGLRRAFATIAKEETQHAALSWSLHEYFATRLSAKDRARVERHRRAATARMEPELTAPLHDSVHVATGIPRPAAARRLYRGVIGTS